MTTAQDIGTAIGRVAEGAGPAVVGLGRAFGPGSGVVVGEGRVLTAAFGTDGASGEAILAGGHRASASSIAADPDLGLALLSTSTDGAPPLEPAPSSDDPASIGTPVIALADPGGRGLRATLGFVSSVGRTFRGPRGRRVEGAIEHTAPLPRGSSGGPLLDLDGRLLGLNVLRREGGLILAVPVEPERLARLERVASGDDAPAPRLGVALAPPHVARRLRRAVGLSEREGLLVRGVANGSPADRAGLARGDLLVTAAGRELGSVDTLLQALDGLARGGELELGLLRGDRELELVARFPGASDDAADHTPEEETA